MNEQLQAELRAMRVEQRALRQQLTALEGSLADFEARVEQADRPVEVAPPVMGVAPPATPTLPPPLPVPAPPLAKLVAPVAPVLAETAIQPPPLLPPRLPKPAPVPPPMPPPLAAKEATVAPPPLPEKRESLEMQIGMVWLVRAGVVAGLTALVFLGSALYQNIIPRLGPAGKVALMYLGAGALTGVGAWLERSRQALDNPRLRNYAQVVFAGGLAAVYYVTYAAHYVERLRVIDSALVAGTLLLAWTAFMVFLAHRRNAETLATVAILLAFYASAVNDGIATFTLVSNLILTGGTVFLLRRHLWRVFPFASVLATFGSYAFWTYHASIISWNGPGTWPVRAQHAVGGFWIEAAFLGIYWALFTWAAFTATNEVLPSLRRAGFASLNNSAFFLLTTWLVLGQGPGWLWKWSLGFGLVLLALAEACRRLPRPADPKTSDAYLLQGVLLVTIGFVAYFDGWQLSIVLAVQAVVLLAAASRRANPWLLGSSMGVALLAFLWSVRSFAEKLSVHEWMTPLAVGGFLVLAAYLAQRNKDRPPASKEAVTAGGVFRGMLDPAPAYFSLLGCIVWFALICDRVPDKSGIVLALVGAAVALTASVYLLRVKAMAVYAQAFLGMGSLVYVAETTSPLAPGVVLNAWTTLGPLAGALALGHWWQHLPGAARWTRGRFTRTVSAVDAVAVVGVVYAWYVGHFWSEARRSSGFLPAGAALLALVVFAYAAATRYRALAVASQGLLLAGVLYSVDLWARPWMGEGTVAALAAVPLLVILAMLAGLRYRLPEDQWSRAIRLTAYFYEGLALLLFLLWVGKYTPGRALMPAFILGGALLFALGIERRVRRWMFLSIVPTVIGLWCFIVGTSEERGSLATLLGVALLVGQQQVGRRRLGDRLATWFPVAWQNALMLAAALCAWVFVSVKAGRWHGSAFTLAASWSVFAAAVFAAGWFLRERVYRWVGLVVMAATFGHLVIFDLTQLDSLGKGIGFLTLMVVLLGAGYAYNKYPSKFRDLL